MKCKGPAKAKTMLKIKQEDLTPLDFRSDYKATFIKTLRGHSQKSNLKDGWTKSQNLETEQNIYSQLIFNNEGNEV